MISRFLGATKGLSLAALAATVFNPSIVWADGPSYTYIGASYEWTDVKYAVKPGADPNFNNSTIEGVNIDASLGILSWLHVNGQYFTGDCKGCTSVVTNSQLSNVDTDFEAYKLGLGVNLGFDLIGLNKDTDFVLRANYIDVLELKTPATLPSCGVPPCKLKGNGWSIEAAIRSQISDRAEVYIGYEYTDLDVDDAPSINDQSLLIGLAYRLGWDIAITADAIVFDDDTGFALGVRWYFADLFFGRDSIVR